MSTKMSQKTQMLTISAIMIALATILSFVKVWEMPFGGSVTLFSMVPLAYLSYRYGVKWGVLTAFVFSLIQMLFGIGSLSAAGNSIEVIIGSCILDYVVAYTMIGFSGIFRNRIKNNALSLSLGFLVATLMRYAVHVISGYIFFRSYAEWYFSQESFSLGAVILEHMSGEALSIFYAFFYNILFLLPDTVVAIVGLIAVALLAKKYVFAEQKAQKA